MSWDAWLDDGKGAFPFGRPIRWMVALLDGEVVPFAIYELVDGARGRPSSRAAHVTLRPSLPAARLGRRAAEGALVRGPREGAARRRFVLLDPAERDARIREELASAPAASAAGRPRPARASGATSSSTRPSWPARVPAEFRSLPTEVLRDRAGAPSEVRPAASAAARSSASPPWSTATAPTRRDRRGAWSAWSSRGCATRRSSSRRTASARWPSASTTWPASPSTAAWARYRDKADRLVAARGRHGRRLALLGQARARGRARGGAALQGRPHHAHGARVPRAAGRDGRHLPARRGSQPATSRGGAAGTTTRSRSRKDAAPARELRRRATPRVFAAVSLADKLDTLAGYFGLGLAPTGQQRPLRPAPGGAGRRPRAAGLLAGRPGGARPSLRRLVAAARWPATGPS